MLNLFSNVKNFYDQFWKSYHYQQKKTIKLVRLLKSIIDYLFNFSTSTYEAQILMNAILSIFNYIKYTKIYD